MPWQRVEKEGKRDARTCREADLRRTDRDGRGVVLCGHGWDVVAGVHDRGTCFASIAFHHFVCVGGTDNNGVVLGW